MGKFIISLDFELHWGGVEKWDVDKKETVKQKEVKRFKFLPWYWAIIAAVVLFIYLKYKRIL